MATRRKIDIQEFQKVATIRNPGSKTLEELEAALKKGASLELEESSFSDPGPDYCKVRLDGVEILHRDGY